MPASGRLRHQPSRTTTPRARAPAPIPRPTVNGDLEIGAGVRIGSARGARVTSVLGVGSGRVVPRRVPVTTASGAEVRSWRGTAPRSGRAAGCAAPSRDEDGRRPGGWTAARLAVFAGADASGLAADERPDERVRPTGTAGSNAASPTSEDWVTTDAGAGAGLAAASPGAAGAAIGAGALEGSAAAVRGSGCTGRAGAATVGGACGCGFVASGVGAAAAGCTGAGAVAGGPAGSGVARVGSKASGST